MVFEVEGEILSFHVSRKEGNRKFLNVAVKRTDGQKDVLTIFTTRDHKPGGVFKGKVDAFIRMCNEVV